MKSKVIPPTQAMRVRMWRRRRLSIMMAAGWCGEESGVKFGLDSPNS